MESDWVWPDFLESLVASSAQMLTEATPKPENRRLDSILVPYKVFYTFTERFLIISAIPSAIFLYASSLSDHLRTGLPSVGRACNLPKGAYCQLTERRITGTTRT